MNSVPLHRQTSIKVAENGVLCNGYLSRRRFGGAVRGMDLNSELGIASSRLFAFISAD